MAGNLLNRTLGLLKKNCDSTLIVDSTTAVEGNAFKDNVEKLVKFLGNCSILKIFVFHFRSDYATVNCGSDRKKRKKNLTKMIFVGLGANVSFVCFETEVVCRYMNCTICANDHEGIF